MIASNPADLEPMRRAAHVKWDGKTIALGTFPAQEAVEKCEQAKALTKKWRATMVPKPDVEWVKKALERLNIRVVNDRPGRRRKDEVVERTRREHTNMGMEMNNRDGVYGLSSQNKMGMGTNHQMSNMNMPYPRQGGYGGLPEGRDVPNEIAMDGMDSFNPMGMMNGRNFGGDEGIGNFPGSMMGGVGTADMEPGINQMMDMGLPMNDAPGMESAAASRQHFTILKEHHDNLLKELQQTTYMMQMYRRNYEDLEEYENSQNPTPMMRGQRAPGMNNSKNPMTSRGFRDQVQVPYNMTDRGKGGNLTPGGQNRAGMPGGQVRNMYGNPEREMIGSGNTGQYGASQNEGMRRNRPESFDDSNKRFKQNDMGMQSEQMMNEQLLQEQIRQEQLLKEQIRREKMRSEQMQMQSNHIRNVQTQQMGGNEMIRNGPMHNDQIQNAMMNRRPQGGMQQARTGVVVDQSSPLQHDLHHQEGV